MTNPTPQRRGRRGSGREAKRARASAGIAREPYIKRKLPYFDILDEDCLLYTSPSPRDKRQSRMPSSA